MLRSAKTDVNTHSRTSSQFAFACGQMQGWRGSMQDSHICGINNIEEGVSLFAVFDGHGGSHVSKYLEEHFIEVFKSQIQFQQRKYEAALQITFSILDKHLDSEEGIKKLKNYNSYNPRFLETTKAQQLQIPPAFLTGSTANVVLITPSKIYVANCGDSRSAMYVSDPISLKITSAMKYLQFSNDHKPENAIQKERIQRANGFVKNGRVDGNFSVSRAFGDLLYKKNNELSYKQQKMTCHPEIRVFQRPKLLKDNSINQSLNFILIGCDGIWQRFEKGSAGLLQIIRCDLALGLSLSQAVKNMLKLLISKNVIETKGHGCDNMSAIVIQLLR